MANNKGLNLYRVSCIGLSPMLQNPMTDETLDDLTFGAAGRRKPPERDVPIKDLAAKKLCLGPNNEFGFPANYLFAALVEAGRHVVFDKKTKISTRESSLLPSLLAVMPDVTYESGDGFIPFLDQDVAWVPDRRRGVLAANGAAVAIIRPKFPKWAFDVTIEVNEDQIAIEKIQDLVNVAGRIAGLGDFRPSRRGQFGRFKVTDFVLAQAEPMKQAA